jgi:polyhydroxyalkanoate synthesis regulator phasin
VKKGIQFLSLGTLLLAFLPAGLAQESPAPDSSAPQAAAQTTTAQHAPPKAKRVWTDDNIGQVRTPEDAYIDQKGDAGELARQKKQQPAPAAQGNAPKPSRSGAPVPKVPDTVSEAEQEIAERQGLLDNFENLSNVTQKQIDETTDPIIRASLQRTAGLVTSAVADTRGDIEMLQKRLAELEAKKKAGHSASPDTSQQ